MNRLRRDFLCRVAGAAALPLLPHAAQAQPYPSRPVRLVIGFAPGGPMDIVARLLGQWLAERLGQPFVVENRPGAGGNIGTEAVVRAPADGHTLLLCGPVNTINTTLYGDRLGFDFARDIAPVAGVVRVPLVMEVHPSVPTATASEFVAYAKANPGKIEMASAGNGTPQHVAGELFKMMAGVDLLHVPYRGSGPALADLLGGRVQVMFDAMPSSIGHIRAGRLRPLAVTTAARSEALPDVPVLADFVSGYEASSWYGIVAPRGTPAAVVDRLNVEINAGLVDPGLRARLAELGGMAMPGTPAELDGLIAGETMKWAEVIRAANITVE
ncbi:Bug family tripartite tricarboxylate transporter substrate binding protein [Paracraurococcus lichenis]|uniref:Tripartite tricarboxylate transporter substrate binding protein n=1 Tax=Paracraurococcus lichenis TaxID=3064888 RepID=A0ABT9E8U8_9PROT|nr:tripartite tricarboxylate transporter substrate binding protein [Paracraurococcus sp. LOR1-02]MDO9712594.1 tripartite tricarboxylate transporter substrate binding protein [Paracraurococcus sp. LOR1-02]